MAYRYPARYGSLIIARPPLSRFPLRTCVGCRVSATAPELCRLAVDTEGQVVIGRALSGRGAWLHPDPDCLALARRRRALPRAFRVSADRLRIDWSVLESGLRAWPRTGLDATDGGAAD